MTPGMPPSIVLTTKNGSSPSHDVMDYVVGNLMTQQLDNRCAEGGICFIDCIKYNQGNAFHQADSMPGGWGGRLRPHNSGRGGAPSSPHFRTVVLFVSSGILHYWDSLTCGIRLRHTVIVDTRKAGNP